MRILNISLDKKILERDSAVQQRILEYGKLVDQYTVIVLSTRNDFFNLGSNIKVISVCRDNKIKGFFNLELVLKKTLKNEKYDLITVQDPYFIAYLALKLARKFKISLEIQVHGFEKLAGIRKLIAKYVLKRANVVRVVSERLKKQLIQSFKVNKDKITVVPIYVDISVKDKESDVKKEKDKFIFLTIGRLVPVKNIEMQIRAMTNLRDKFKNIELWIVGEGSKKYELKENVKFLGYQKDLSRFYQQANCFLLTSNYEGWGMVIVEAASHGLPIIMTDVGCAGEFIKDNENGIVIPIKNQKILEKRMEELVENRELRERLSNNAKDSIKNLLTKEETLNLYLKSWEKSIL
jgi:glycosyltransferase involved in cell wall biosynthesis